MNIANKDHLQNHNLTKLNSNAELTKTINVTPKKSRELPLIRSQTLKMLYEKKVRIATTNDDIMKNISQIKNQHIVNKKEMIDTETQNGNDYSISDTKNKKVSLLVNKLLQNYGLAQKQNEDDLHEQGLLVDFTPKDRLPYFFTSPEKTLVKHMKTNDIRVTKDEKFFKKVGSYDFILPTLTFKKKPLQNHQIEKITRFMSNMNENKQLQILDIIENNPSLVNKFNSYGYTIFQQSLVWNNMNLINQFLHQQPDVINKLSRNNETCSMIYSKQLNLNFLTKIENFKQDLYFKDNLGNNLIIYLMKNCKTEQFVESYKINQEINNCHEQFIKNQLKNQVIKESNQDKYQEQIKQSLNAKSLDRIDKNNHEFNNNLCKFNHKSIIDIVNQQLSEARRIIKVIEQLKCKNSSLQYDSELNFFTKIDKNNENLNIEAKYLNMEQLDQVDLKGFNSRTPTDQAFQNKNIFLIIQMCLIHKCGVSREIINKESTNYGLLDLERLVLQYSIFKMNILSEKIIKYLQKSNILSILLFKTNMIQSINPLDDHKSFGLKKIMETNILQKYFNQLKSNSQHKQFKNVIYDQELDIEFMEMIQSSIKGEYRNLSN